MTDAMRVWEEAFGAGFIDGQATTDPDAAAAVIERALAERDAEQRGAEAERARIVAWLNATRFGDDDTDRVSVYFADALERGDHMGDA